MDKSGFRRFFFFCFFLSLSHSYQFVRIVSFLGNIGDIHKYLKISIIQYFRNLFRSTRYIHINNRINLEHHNKGKVYRKKYKNHQQTCAMNFVSHHINEKVTLFLPAEPLFI